MPTAPNDLPLRVLERAAAVIRAASPGADAGDLLGCHIVTVVLAAREMGVSQQDLVSLVGEAYADAERLRILRDPEPEPAPTSVRPRGGLPS